MDSRNLYHLDKFEECIGILQEFVEYEGFIIVKVGGIDLGLPLYLSKVLRSLIGQKISILRTSIKGKEFLVLLRGDRNKPLKLITTDGSEIRQKMVPSVFDNALNFDSFGVINLERVIEA